LLSLAKSGVFPPFLPRDAICAGLFGW